MLRNKKVSFKMPTPKEFMEMTPQQQEAILAKLRKENFHVAKDQRVVKAEINKD
jgi:hypothetical protein